MSGIPLECRKPQVSSIFKTSGYTMHTRSSQPFQNYYDSIYISKNINESGIAINVIQTLPLSITLETPGMYEGLLHHLNNEIQDFTPPLYDISNITETPDGHPAIKITLNAATFGYYLPATNTFIIGDITWHAHYATILLPLIWHQILQGVLP